MRIRPDVPISGWLEKVSLSWVSGLTFLAPAAGKTTAAPFATATADGTPLSITQAANGRSRAARTASLRLSPNTSGFGIVSLPQRPRFGPPPDLEHHDGRSDSHWAYDTTCARPA